jgi:uncharacterized protein YjbI with pentapeptide repeats
MTDPEHVAKLLEGSNAWNAWRDTQHQDFIPLLSRIKFSGPSLNGANLSRAILRGADFSEADLKAVNLTLADLSNSKLVAANLTNANISQALLGNANLEAAALSGADLTSANLSRSILTNADLTVTNLNGANLSNANLSGSVVGWTVFADTYLSSTSGLSEVKHVGPSSIGIDTIYESAGLAENFLRGCGVPENFIAYARSLVGRAIEFYSCFISYSTKDQEFATRVHADLRAAGVRCWFAPHDIQGGRKIHDQIDEAIRLYDRLVLILSEDSMKSEWVKTEIAHARQKEVNEKRQVLFPLSLVEYAKVRSWKCPDGDTGKDSAREIREYFISDFSAWKDHES